METMGDMKGSSGFTFGLETGLTINKQQPIIKKKQNLSHNIILNSITFLSFLPALSLQLSQ